MIKKILCSLLLIYTAQLSAQLRVVTATAGEGRNVDWASIKKKENSEVDGPGFFYNPCSQGVIMKKASSTLAPQGKYSYGIDKMSDSDPMTAWVEGKKGYGIGEWFEVEAQNINSIYNGYQFSSSIWLSNSRVKRFKVYYDGSPICYLDLKDEMGAQNFDLQLGDAYDYNTMHTFKFEIVEVFKGAKYDDVCISHIDFVLCCFNEGTTISTGTGNILVDEIASGDEIKTYDLASEMSFDSKVTSSTNQTHVTLLKVTTANHQIEITPDHPLFIKDHSFISLQDLLKSSGLTNITQLAGSTEVMTWNETTNKADFEVITNIEVIQGKFSTYTLLGLETGDTYFANGFLTKTY